MTKRVPAPWNLTGDGYIILYRFQKEFVEKNGFVSPETFSCFKGGFGLVMLVNYSSSTAGPYQELLFMPGRFSHEGKTYFSISKIYVSTMESVVNGRENWGIPKELADFNFHKTKDRTERIIVSVNGRTCLDITLLRRRLYIPISTNLYPLPLMHNLEGKSFFTSFQGSGYGKLAKIINVTADSALFPDIAQFRPWYVKRIENFHITFPVAKIISGN